MLPVRSLWLSMLVLITFMVGAAPAALAVDRRGVFTAQLLGAHEVPPVNTEGAAVLKLTLHDASIDFELHWANLSAGPAAAHIHFGQPLVNGGVVIFFCGGGGLPACPATASGSISGTLTATEVVGPTAQGVESGDLDALVRAIRTGEAYANMHTARFPSGEIRGQIVPALLLLN